MTVTVTISYSCKECGLVKRELEISERGLRDNVVDWIRTLTAIVWTDHRETSPRCRADKIHELYVPISPDGEVGRPVRH